MTDVASPPAPEPVAPQSPPSSGRRWRLPPVVRHELTDRFRGSRGGRVVTGTCAFMGLVLVLLYLMASSIARFDAGFDQATVGRFLAENFLAIEAALVLLVAAGYAGAQIAAERERQTLPLLQVTAMTPTQIVVGKWLAVVAWVGLLVVMGMPFAAAAAFFGGVELVDVLLASLHIILVSAALLAVAIWISARVRKTSTAIVVTYLVLVLVAIGPGMTAIVESIVTRGMPSLSVAVHPLTGLAVAADAGFSGMMPTVLSPFALGLEGEFDRIGLAQDAGRNWTLLVGQWVAAVAVTFVALRRASRLVQPGRGPRRRRGKSDEPDQPDGSVADVLVAPAPSEPPPAPPAAPPAGPDTAPDRTTGEAG